MNFVLVPEAALLQPIKIGGFEARNRIFMAPMTRSRSESDGTPSELQVDYYTQRASAGLIISESTAVSALGNGAYLNTPGIYTDQHQQSWAWWPRRFTRQAGGCSCSCGTSDAWDILK